LLFIIMAVFCTLCWKRARRIKSNPWIWCILTVAAVFISPGLFGWIPYVVLRTFFKKKKKKKKKKHADKRVKQPWESDRE
ncbi:MAG: hypothetical protein OXC97_05650, partial [Candidatus Dadabacteria bacterium]|nr:hypothetical protein [Candidatus Dadabacteria bacterium]